MIRPATPADVALIVTFIKELADYEKEPEKAIATEAQLRQLAVIAAERGYYGVTWSVLKWNKPSIDFYEALGATEQHEWTSYRVMDGALEALAQ